MIDSLLLQKRRRETPGLTQSVHLNHAGASLLSKQTLASIKRHFFLESEIGPIEAAARVEGQIGQLRLNAATLINASVGNIALMPSGSAAFGAVFSSLPPIEQGQTILVGRHEWGGNLTNYERLAARCGASVKVIPCKMDGSVDADALASIVDDSTYLISLTWLPSNGGLINDAAAIGRVARRFKVPYFLDASQALGHLPIDVENLQCDVLFATCRKHLRGPRGTALLYVREGLLETLDPKYVDSHSAPRNALGAQFREDARRFECSDNSVALWLGLSNAIAELMEIGIDVVSQQQIAIARQLRERLEVIPGVCIRDLGSANLSAIVSFTVDGIDVPSIKHQLGFSGVQIASNGMAYTPLDMKCRGLNFVARASISYLNTQNDLDFFLERIRVLSRQ